MSEKGKEPNVNPILFWISISELSLIFGCEEEAKHETNFIIICI